jgi:geranylgeranyl pyrophosphate synthase
MNSAYFMTFKLLDSVPRLFRRHHADTVKLIVDGTVKAHRGQGLELYWRDNHICPTEEEYVQMVRGKTSTPFLLAAQLFFLHADDIRLSAVRFAQPWMNRIADLVGGGERRDKDWGRCQLCRL